MEEMTQLHNAFGLRTQCAQAMHNASPRWHMLLLQPDIIYNRIAWNRTTLLPLIQPLVHDLGDLVVNLVGSTLCIVQPTL